MQEGISLDFTSMELLGHNLAKLMYEKEIMAIIHIVRRWKPDLIDRHFIIHTNHHNLKYFMEQRILTLE